MAGFLRLKPKGEKGISISIGTKLFLGYVIIITAISAIFVTLGIRLISDRIIEQAEEKVGHDLNTAREIYQGKMSHVNDVVRFTAARFFLRDVMLNGEFDQAIDELVRIQEEEDLDVLTVTDDLGNVVLRTSNLDVSGDNQKYDEILTYTLQFKKPAISTVIVPREELVRARLAVNRAVPPRDLRCA